MAQIETVRERSGFRQERLRHLHATPESVRQFFDTKDKEVAGDNRSLRPIESSAFSDPCAIHSRTFSFTDPDLGPTCYFAVFKISQSKVQRQTKKGVPNQDHIFPDRIDGFLEEIQSDGSLDKSISLKRPMQCLVFGLRPDNEAGLIEQMVALYVAPPIKLKTITDGFEFCAHIVAEMFRTVEEIRIRERSEFEREALNRIVELAPTFADDDVSPSDAVAALLQTFKNIFYKHEYFGAGRIQTATDKDEEHQWVTFLSVNYVANLSVTNNAATPVLAVYPKSAAMNSYVQSYRVSLPEEMSISKYLLREYLHKQSVSTPDDFRNLFKDVQGVPDKAFYNDKVSGVPLGLILTTNDHDWQKLQRHIFREEETKTTAAFLLRRSKGDKNRPFAILVVESDYADAFSLDDITLISRLVDASAALLSTIKLGSHSIDYSARLKVGLRGRGGQPIGGVRYSDIAHEMLRVDYHAALEILRCDNPRLWDASSLKQKSVRDAVSEIVEVIARFGDDQVALYRWLWSNETIELIRANWKDGYIADIHRFLVAVPSNNIWYCYLGSVDRALADRHFEPSKPPTFTRFRPGHSALAMFVVDGMHQNSQIAKLTTKAKLLHERKLYTDYVRYKIPLAARIPENGTAFDTVGTAPGNRCHSTDTNTDIGFGVIISDLIVGNSAEAPVSFLSLCVDVINDPKKNSVSVSEIAVAIKYHFMENVRIWKVEGHKEWVQKRPEETEGGEVEAFIEQLTRTGANKSELATIHNRMMIDDRLREVATEVVKKEELSVAAFEMLEATVSYFSNHIQRLGTGGGVSDFAELGGLAALVEVLIRLRQNRSDEENQLNNMAVPKYFNASFVHGDLNGHNLTWAAHYNRFVMIDFENIALGFDGIDQLKLLASMICETVPAAHDPAPKEKRKRVNDIENRAMVSLVRFISWLIRDVIQAGDSVRCTNTVSALVSRCQENEKTDSVASMLSIALAIIGTIEFHDLNLSTVNEQLFWRLTLRNLFYRQFEYAYRELDSKHIKALNAVTTSINSMEKPGMSEDDSVDSYAYMTGACTNALGDSEDNNVIMLFYSFLALLATL
ncbi:MAG: hypothetical protein EXS05_09620 [Planctomycetaceae bacterium]|nr:hypothetical protein [Planctomycetaceae bacterium]